MRAMVLEAMGQDLALRDCPIPAPGPGEVQISVDACGLNFADTLMQKGQYQERPALPFVPGMELAGVITATGPNVALSIGARVAAYAGYGGLADYAVVPAAVCVTLPDAMPSIEAAAFLVAYATSHLALGPLAQLQPNERLLITGASGGVGLTAIEIGKLLGAEVIAVARGAEKLRIAQEAGADHLIDGADPDLRGTIKALGGADVVYETIGGTFFDAALRSTNPGARILPIGFASGDIPQIPANYLLVKNLSVIGFWIGGYRQLRPTLLAESFQTLLRWYEKGQLSPHISNVLPLEEANQGLELLRKRAATGKVVIEI